MLHLHTQFIYTVQSTDNEKSVIIEQIIVVYISSLVILKLG